MCILLNNGAMKLTYLYLKPDFYIIRLILIHI